MGSSSRVQQEGVAAVQPGGAGAVDEGDGDLDAVGRARPQALRPVVAAAEAAQHRLHLLRLPACAQRDPPHITSHHMPAQHIADCLGVAERTGLASPILLECFLCKACLYRPPSSGIVPGMLDSEV